ncbi:MAG: hypothetical protein ABSD73_02750 [Candidatus Bathyarchaeia archaeon]|jgi:hypothetical protein
MSSRPFHFSDSDEKELDLLSKMPTETRSQEQERRLLELLDKRRKMNEDSEDRELSEKQRQALQEDIHSVMDVDDGDNDKSHLSIYPIPEKHFVATEDKTGSKKVASNQQ